jgi:hypothetical protein
MFRRLALLVCLLAGTAGLGVASAQDPPAQKTLPGPAFLRNMKVDQAGGLHFTKHFSVVFGGIKQGSGMAIGPAVSHLFEDGSYVQVKGVYSIRNFKLLQGRYDSRPFAGKRLTVSSRGRWQDAPTLALYRLGTDSPNLRAEYSERRIEWSGVVRAGVGAKSVLLAGTGIERYATSGGWVDASEDDLPDVPQTPGLGARPWLVHTFTEFLYHTRLWAD